MGLDTLLIGAPIAVGSIGLISVAQGVLSEKYVRHIHKLNQEGKLKLLPLYAQELYSSSVRSLALAGENHSFSNKLKATLHYQFTEFPTFKALYRFFTLDNPHGRDLF